MIRYLNQEDKKKTRFLYEEAFPEDTGTFADFYYRTKMKDNIVLADTDGDEIRSMAHLNPYDVMVGERKYRLDYIVAVSTAEKYRRRGLMRGIMNQLLSDLQQARCPFTFLNPADPAYYTSFDFTYVFDRPGMVLGEAEKNSLKAVPWEKAYLQEGIRFSNEWLKKHAEVYCVRNEEYFEELEGELKAAGGRLEVLLDAAGKMAGMRAFDYADTEEYEARYILRDDIGRKQAAAKPFMMARIVDLKQFVKSVCLKKECDRNERTFRIRVKDPVLPENNGTFLWKADRETSRLERTEDEKDAATEFTVAELTSWLFGYAECRKAQWCENIRTLSAVYLDEET